MKDLFYLIFIIFIFLTPNYTNASNRSSTKEQSVFSTYDKTCPVQGIVDGLNDLTTREEEIKSWERYYELEIKNIKKNCDTACNDIFWKNAENAALNATKVGVNIAAFSVVMIIAAMLVSAATLPLSILTGLGISIIAIGDYFYNQPQIEQLSQTGKNLRGMSESSRAQILQDQLTALTPANSWSANQNSHIIPPATYAKQLENGNIDFYSKRERTKLVAERTNEDFRVMLEATSYPIDDMAAFIDGDLGRDLEFIQNEVKPNSKKLTNEQLASLYNNHMRSKINESMGQFENHFNKLLANESLTSAEKEELQKYKKSFMKYLENTLVVNNLDWYKDNNISGELLVKRLEFEAKYKRAFLKKMLYEDTSENYKKLRRQLISFCKTIIPYRSLKQKDTSSGGSS